MIALMESTKIKVFTFIKTKKKVRYLLKTMLILNKINFFTKFKWRMYKHHGGKITHRRKTIEKNFKRGIKMTCVVSKILH